MTNRKLYALRKDGQTKVVIDLNKISLLQDFDKQTVKMIIDGVELNWHFDYNWQKEDFMGRFLKTLDKALGIDGPEALNRGRGDGEG